MNAIIRNHLKLLKQINIMKVCKTILFVSLCVFAINCKKSDPDIENNTKLLIESGLWTDTASRAVYRPDTRDSIGFTKNLKFNFKKDSTFTGGFSSFPQIAGTWKFDEYYKKIYLSDFIPGFNKNLTYFRVISVTPDILIVEEELEGVWVPLTNNSSVYIAERERKFIK
jgi:hypothetical protein